jgi:lincosamide nucleotidyltransferase
LTSLAVGSRIISRFDLIIAFRKIGTVDRLLELVDFIEDAEEAYRDPFANERRFEQLFPEVTSQISLWMQGYEKNPESALAILAFLEKYFEVNHAIATAIRELCS